jgi:hypothetical protein
VKKPALLIAVLVIAVALLESALGLIQPRLVASDADWRAATEHVRAQLAADDLVVFAPRWIDPTGRMYLGDRMPVEMVARADAEPYARIWELSVHGARAEETAALPMKEERAFGRVTVRRYDQPAKKVLRDLTSAFADARLTISPREADDESPCTADGKARRCGGSKIEPRVLEIDYRPRRGILVPAQNGQRISIVFSDVPGGQLVGYVGLHDYYARKNGDGLATLRVRAETSAVVRPVRTPAREGEGWQRFELELGPGTHTVRFEIEGQGSNRLVGFHAEVRQP